MNAVHDALVAAGVKYIDMPATHRVWARCNRRGVLKEIPACMPSNINARNRSPTPRSTRPDGRQGFAGGHD